MSEHADHCDANERAWVEFLLARERVICWLMQGEGQTPEQVAQTLSMDPGQVLSINRHHMAVSA